MGSIDRVDPSMSRVDRIEQAQHRGLDGGLGGPVERWAQPIWTGGAGSVHAIDGSLYLLCFKRGRERRPVHPGSTLVQEGQVKPPAHRPGAAQ